MKAFIQVLSGALLLSGLACAQNTFAVTGTAIPTGLLQLNYGKLPKGVAGYDLNICNSSGMKQSIVSSEIYQALAQSNPGLQPIGREIMLAAILRNQNRSAGAIVTMALNSATTMLSVLSATKYGVPAGVMAGAALGAISAQQIFTNFKPIFPADQIEKFEQQVLESALVLDGGSCVERTVFAAAPNSSNKPHALAFHVR